MEVVAFAPSLDVALDESGGVSVRGFPMTSCAVDSFPAQITMPLVLAVYTQSGTDYDPERFIIAKSPQGETVGIMQCRWHWPDNPDSGVKYRVFAHKMLLNVSAAGMYSIGLFESRHAVETAYRFPLPVVKANPLAMAQPPSPGTV